MKDTVMTSVQTGPLSSLADKVLANAKAWHREPHNDTVLADGVALIKEGNLDEAIRSVETEIVALHGATSFNHYRGWLLDEACMHLNVQVVDGEVCVVRSRLFLITLQGASSVIDDASLVAALGEDLATSFEMPADAPEFITFLPHAFTIGALARVGPGQVQELLKRSVSAFSNDETLVWSDLLAIDGGSEWTRSTPMLQRGERALIGISHAIIDKADESALQKFQDADYAQRWNRGVNAPINDGIVRITATLGWTTTLVGMALQRFHAGFTAEAMTLGRTLNNPMLHYAPTENGLIEAWLEDAGKIYGPMTAPIECILADERYFQKSVHMVAGYYIRYQNNALIPRQSDTVKIQYQ